MKESESDKKRSVHNEDLRNEMRIDSLLSDSARVREILRKDSKLSENVHKVLGSIEDQEEPARIWNQISVYPVNERTMTRIHDFLHVLESIAPKNIRGFEMNLDDILIWTLGTIIRHRSDKEERFKGKLKLHKMIYFFQEFFLSSPSVGFVFEREQFGVFSYDLESCIHKLDGSYIKAFEGKGREAEGYRYWVFKLEKKGRHRFQQIERELLEDFPEDFDKLRSFLVYIYQQDSKLLGAASKAYYVDKGFAPFVEPILRRKILREVEDMIEDKIKELAEGERSIERYSHEELYWPTIQPASIFDHGAYLFINRIPTNYVIPIEYFENDDALLMQIAKDHFEKIREIENRRNLKIEWIFVKKRNTTRKIAGILEEMRPVIPKEMRLPFEVRVFETPSDQEGTTGFSNMRPGHGVILFDVTFSGRSVLMVKEELQKHGIQVEAIFTFADRQCGAREVIENSGIQFFSYLTKEDIIDYIQEDKDIYPD